MKEKKRYTIYVLYCLPLYLLRINVSYTREIKASKPLVYGHLLCFSKAFHVGAVVVPPQEDRVTMLLKVWGKTRYNTDRNKNKKQYFIKNRRPKVTAENNVSIVSPEHQVKA